MLQTGQPNLGLLQNGQPNLSMLQTGQQNIGLLQNGQPNLNMLSNGQVNLSMLQTGQPNLGLLQNGLQGLGIQQNLGGFPATQNNFGQGNIGMVSGGVQLGQGMNMGLFPSSFPQIVQSGIQNNGMEQMEAMLRYMNTVAI